MDFENDTVADDLSGFGLEDEDGELVEDFNNCNENDISDGIRCKSCKHVNPNNATVCEECGESLTNIMEDYI